ncbi:MAG: hypothetical protein ABI208_05000 [Ginsengibacter sp.]|jgi:hypothetical protein
MKNEKEMPQASKGKKTGSNSNPENKFKKGQSTTAAEIDNIIKGSVENVKPQSGEGFTDKGTVSIYGDES